MGHGVEEEWDNCQINTLSREARQGWAQKTWNGTRLPSAAGSGGGSRVDWNFRAVRMFLVNAFYIFIFSFIKKSWN